MERFYAAYVGHSPVATDIKGHRFIVVSDDHSTLRVALDKIGATRVKEFKTRSIHNDIKLVKIAKKARANIVFAPAGTTFDEIVRTLESELPWAH
jgi:hypothetical protein